MMVIGLASIGLLVNHQKRWGRWVLGGVLFGLSVSIKYATILLIPAYGLYKLLAAKKQKLSWGTIGSISQMLPLLTSQSKWFLPWYLIWPMSLEPMGISIIWKRVLGLFTMTGLLSYIPYLLIGGYSDTQQWQRLVILWLLPLLYLGYEWVNRLLSRRDL
jgi:hypothetical protein